MESRIHEHKKTHDLHEILFKMSSMKCFVHPYTVTNLQPYSVQIS